MNCCRRVAATDCKGSTLSRTNKFCLRSNLGPVNIGDLCTKHLAEDPFRGATHLCRLRPPAALLCWHWELDGAAHYLTCSGFRSAPQARVPDLMRDRALQRTSQADRTTRWLEHVTAPVGAITDSDPRRTRSKDTVTGSDSLGREASGYGSSNQGALKVAPRQTGT